MGNLFWSICCDSL